MSCPFFCRRLVPSGWGALLDYTLCKAPATGLDGMLNPPCRGDPAKCLVNP